MIAGACGGSSGPVPDGPDGDHDDTDDVEPEESEGDSGSGDDEPEPQPEPATRDDYVAAVEEILTGAPPGVVDVACLAAGVVDAVGPETLRAVGAEPADFARIDSLEELGLAVTAELRADVAASFETCVDGGALAGELLPSLGLGLPDAVLDCVSEAVGDLVETSLADEFVDGSGGLGAETFSDAARLGAACSVQLAAEAPGSEVAWGDGEDVFSDALLTRMTTPAFEGATALADDEGACVVPRVVEILAPAMSAEPSITVGDLVAYLGTAVTPAAIGLAVDEATATALAEANLGCVDQNRISAEAMGPVLEQMLGAADIDALVACLDREITDEVQLGGLVLQYRFGTDVYSRPEFQAFFDASALAGETCTLELMRGSG